MAEYRYELVAQTCHPLLCVVWTGQLFSECTIGNIRQIGKSILTNLVCSQLYTMRKTDSDNHMFWVGFFIRPHHLFVLCRVIIF